LDFPGPDDKEASSENRSRRTLFISDDIWYRALYQDFIWPLSPRDVFILSGRSEQGMARTGIVKDKRYMLHQMGEFHPESPERLKVVYQMLEDPGLKGYLEEVPPRKAEIEELLSVHSLDYIHLIASTDGKEYTYLDPDTQTSAGSYEAALLAAGGVCNVTSRVYTGELKNAFALIRPPGHHAERDRAMGFCLFNNVAIGARFAQKSFQLERILIVDWDLHHGNGTQHAFENDPSVLYFSTHQSPYYPGTGSLRETGTGAGQGYTVNIPLTTGFGDAEFITLYERVLTPIALQFNPELILVSAGFDIYMEDPLGGMNVTPEGFAGLTRSLMDIAQKCCQGRIVFVLEGGYSLKGLRDSVRAVLQEMAGLTKSMTKSYPESTNPERINPFIEQIIGIQKSYWKTL
jgi:acetoin utilization deacetylase AcuC-like enzyme